MNNHAPYPSLSQRHAEQIAGRAEATNAGGWAYSPDTKVLIVWTVQDRRVAGWTITGPLEPDEAAEMLRNSANRAIEITPAPWVPPVLDA